LYKHDFYPKVNNAYLKKKGGKKKKKEYSYDPLKAIYDTLRDQNNNLTLVSRTCCGYENEITTLSAFSSLAMFFVMGW